MTRLHSRPAEDPPCDPCALCLQVLQAQGFIQDRFVPIVQEIGVRLHDRLSRPAACKLQVHQHQLRP